MKQSWNCCRQCGLTPLQRRPTIKILGPRKTGPHWKREKLPSKPQQVTISTPENVERIWAMLIGSDELRDTWMVGIGYLVDESESDGGWWCGECVSVMKGANSRTVQIAFWTGSIGYCAVWKTIGGIVVPRCMSVCHVRCCCDVMMVNTRHHSLWSFWVKYRIFVGLGSLSWLKNCWAF